MKREKIDRFWILGKDITLADGNEDFGPRLHTNGSLMNLTERIS